MSTIKVENLTGITSGANANKIIVPAGQTLDASAATLVPSAGAVVQVQQFYDATTPHNTSTSTSFAATGIAKSITPKYSNSLIIIQSNITMTYATNWWQGQMYLNGSAMAGSNMYQYGYVDNAHNAYSPMIMQAQHQCTSTSALNFELYAKTQGSTSYITHLNASAAITLWEIKV